MLSEFFFVVCVELAECPMARKTKVGGQMALNSCLRLEDLSALAARERHEFDVSIVRG